MECHVVYNFIHNECVLTIMEVSWTAKVFVSYLKVMHHCSCLRRRLSSGDKSN